MLSMNCSSCKKYCAVKYLNTSVEVIFVGFLSILFHNNVTSREES